MNTRRDEIAIALAGSNYIYRLLKRVFAGEPNLQLTQALTDEFTDEALSLFLSEESFAPYKELFAQLKQATTADCDKIISHLKGEYTYLMLGPGKLPAPPWESVYVNKTRMLFQESTLEVRRAYLEYNLLPAEYPHVADDHIAMELDFMARLGQLAEQSLEAGDTAQLQKILSSQKAFLENHLLVWIGDFAQEMQSATTHYLYPQMACLTKEFLHASHSAISELISAIAN